MFSRVPINIRILFFALFCCAYFLPLTANSQVNYINPRNIGNCLWDGEHDVSPCIQEAIDAAAPKASSVRIPSGRWPLRKVLVLADNVTIQGDVGGSILQPTEDNTSWPVLLVGKVGTRNVLVENITFDGGGPDFSNPKPIIEATGTSKIIFDNIVLRNSRGAGIVLQGGTQFSGIRNSHFLNIGNHWKHTHLKNDRYQAIVFCCGKGNVNNFATDNRFDDIGLDALQIANQNSFIALRNSFSLEGYQWRQTQFGDYPAAIFALQSTNVTIRENTIINAPGSGIDAPGLQDSLISQNIISGCGSAGIGIFVGYDKKMQSSHIFIQENTISNNAQWARATFVGGITVSGGSPTEISISGNTVTDTQGIKTQSYGILVRGVTNAATIRADRSNRLTGNRIGERARHE